MSLVDDLVQSAALAATDGTGFSDRGIPRVLDLGQRAATGGCLLPLPLLLDTSAMVGISLSQPPPFRRLTSTAPREIESYHDWLDSFARRARRCLALQRRQPASDSDIAPDLLPLLVHVWRRDGGKDEKLDQWAEAYRTLRQDPSAAAKIKNVWTTARAMDAGLWQKWFSRSLEDRGLSPAAVMWSSVQDSRHTPVPETFDHMAAHIYMEAADLTILPDQERRIIELCHQRERQLSLKPPEGFDMLNPYVGSISLLTLAWDDYGLFKAANHTDPRISDAVLSLPPPPVDVHLCWAHGRAGLGSEHTCLPGAAPRSPLVRATGASTLRGIVGLLLDDWQVALHRLKVNFHVHNGRPDLSQDRLERSGKRWKEAAGSDGPLSNRVVLNKLFTRSNWVTIDPNSLKWDAPTLAGWWCACLLTSDLPELGFTMQTAATPESPYDSPTWMADGAALAECISDVILVDVAGEDHVVASMCQVIRNANGKEPLELHPKPWRPVRVRDVDSSFLALRTNALDLVLDGLSRKIR
ncbi:MAG: hypothetical protein JXM73_17125 [Anaerolineae bacterium]|nr:hypothetical protein [Anaerolineae bacterium]